jgi:nucleoside diphosphate kinase
MFHLSASESQALFALNADLPSQDHHISHLASGALVAMEIVSANAVAAWLALLGPDDPEVARKTVPSSIRARFGTDLVKNACNGSTSEEVASKVRIRG